MTFNQNQEVQFTDGTSIIINKTETRFQDLWINFSYNGKSVWGLYRNWGGSEFIETAQIKINGMRFYKRITK